MMKKNKNWLKEQLSYLQDGVGESFNDYSEGLNAAYNTLELLIDQLEEPELPVIPRFVAEAIEKYKEHDDSLGELLASVEHANIKYYHNMEKYRVDFDNLYESGVDLCAIIARAWLDGYEVEKQPKYLVILANGKNKGEGQALYKDFNFNGDKVVSTHIESFNKRTALEADNFCFTEQEIKAIDERYWAFAEEITK